MLSWSPQKHSGLILGLRPANEKTSLQSNTVSHWLGANLEYQPWTFTYRGGPSMTGVTNTRDLCHSRTHKYPLPSIIKCDISCDFPGRLMRCMRCQTDEINTSLSVFTNYSKVIKDKINVVGHVWLPDAILSFSYCMYSRLEYSMSKRKWLIDAKFIVSLCYIFFTNLFIESDI